MMQGVMNLTIQKEKPVSLINSLSIVNTPIQPFKVQAFKQGKFIEVTEQSLKGKWSVLVFMPAAFTFNCPTEVEDAADNYEAFQKLGAEIYIDAQGRVHDTATGRSKWQDFLLLVLDAAAEFKAAAKKPIRDHSMALYVRRLENWTDWKA